MVHEVEPERDTYRRMSAEDEEMFAKPNSSPSSIFTEVSSTFLVYACFIISD